MKILITADWHIKGERPICRLDDDWIESQRRTISEIRAIFEINKCDQIWILGDLFDAPRCSTEAVNMLISELQKFPVDSVKVLCGNHDLKDHNFDNLEVCSIGTIKKLFGNVPTKVEGLKVTARHFGLDEEKVTGEIVCTHQLTFPDEESRPLPDCGTLAQELLDKWTDARIIFTGDYHHGYIYREPGSSRFVVTSGCINIQKADELDYKPFVVLWNTSKLGEEQFEKSYLETQADQCTRDHIEAREHKEAMLSEVVETIKGGTEITLDFETNLGEQVMKTTSPIIEEYNILRQEINSEK